VFRIGKGVPPFTIPPENIPQSSWCCPSTHSNYFYHTANDYQGSIATIKHVAISTLTINRSMIFFYYGLEGHTPITLLNLSNSFVKIRVINVLFLIAIVGEIQSFFVCLFDFIIIASLNHFLICNFLFIFDRIF
jgi:hypothetical protein